MGFHKSTLVARGATRQLDPSCLNHPQLAIDRTGAGFIAATYDVVAGDNPS